jgi:glycosyltransferase involved in cell wall biosynthesis
MRFSVIVPNYNGKKTLGETLSALSRAVPPPAEVIVSDDGSADGSERIAGEFGAKLIRSEIRRGASANRNAGAAAASGEILVFIDADALVPPETFAVLAGRFSDPAVAGVIGLLRPLTRFPDLCSQYKNFYMHYTYSRLPDPVTVFYTSIAAVRKEVFRSCGGFDARYRSATIEDMEFGVRMTAQGHRIVLDRRLQVEHIKKYSFALLMKTAFRRASGLAKIALRDRLSRGRKKSYVTTSTSFLAGIVLSFLALAGLLTTLVFPPRPCLLFTLLSYLALLALNAGFLIGFARTTRPLYGVLACGLIFLDLLAHGAGVIQGGLSFGAGEKY